MEVTLVCLLHLVEVGLLAVLWAYSKRQDRLQWERFIDHLSPPEGEFVEPGDDPFAED